MKDKQSKPVFTVDYKVAAPRQFREARCAIGRERIASTLVYLPFDLAT